MNEKMRALRDEYVLYMVESGKSKNTANTSATEIFALWNKCGEEYFWTVIRASDGSMQEMMTDFLEKYYPRLLKYKSVHITSLRYFREFLAVKENGVTIPDINSKVVQKYTAASKSHCKVLTLSSEMLDREHQIVLNDPGYGTDYSLINSILNRFPLNDDLELVALKIALIDMTNSTNIGRQRKKIVVTELATVITGIKDFDERLRQGDESLVPIIAKNNGSINLFSFASKYCTYHAVDVYGKDDYVIFDSVVKEALPKYVPGLRKATIESWRKEYNYLAYKQCIDNLLDANGIYIPFRHRKLDHYLWHKYRKREETVDNE